MIFDLPICSVLGFELICKEDDRLSLIFLLTIPAKFHNPPYRNKLNVFTTLVSLYMICLCGMYLAVVMYLIYMHDIKLTRNK
jgi:hypothetical protein